MASRPTDDELQEMLRALPRPGPPTGFAEGVMERVRAEERRNRFRPWLLAAAAVALVASGLFVRSVWTELKTESDEALLAVAPNMESPAEIIDSDRQEFEAILEEYRLLVEEIEAMRHLGGEPPYGPLIRLGGNGDLDLFLDLESYLAHPDRPSSTSLVVPAIDRNPRY